MGGADNNMVGVILWEEGEVDGDKVYSLYNRLGRCVSLLLEFMARNPCTPPTRIIQI